MSDAVWVAAGKEVEHCSWRAWMCLSGHGRQNEWSAKALGTCSPCCRHGEVPLDEQQLRIAVQAPGSGRASLGGLLLYAACNTAGLDPS